MASNSVYVDTCWFQHGFMKKLEMYAANAKWGDANISVPFQRYVDTPIEPGSLTREIPHLPSIAQLSRSGRISLHVSDIVYLELIGAPGTSRPMQQEHVFFGAKISEFISGFQPTLVFAQGKVFGGQLERFFRAYPDEELQEMVSRIGKRHVLDAVHLLAAIKHEMRYFLCDSKFLTAVRSQKLSFPTDPITPSELVRRFELTKK